MHAVHSFEEASPLMLTLPNGIRVIHRSCKGSVSCCGFAVNTGSRHEAPNESGMAHFMEHMLFKGTSHRKGHHILNRMESVGGELNAYTTKEETVFYSLFLEKDMERAMELLCDLVFNSVFPTAEIEKERLVILDEINSYEDNPSELIFDDFEDILFDNHPIGRRILGTPDSLKRYEQSDFIRFHSKNYTTDNLVFFSQSPIPLKTWQRMLDRYVGAFGSTGKVQRNIDKPIPLTGIRKVVEKDTHQAHVVMGNRHYDYNDPKRVGMYLLNNMLGGPGMNSRLNLALRERNGLVYSVESNVTSYTDSGIFTIYFGTDVNKVDRCLSLVDRELKRFREQPLTTLQLHAAQQQLFGQMMISSENKENSTLAMGKSMLHFNRFDSLDVVAGKVLKFTASELRDIANELMNPDNMCRLIYT